MPSSLSNRTRPKAGRARICGSGQGQSALARLGTRSKMVRGQGTKGCSPCLLAGMAVGRKARGRCGLPRICDGTRKGGRRGQGKRQVFDVVPARRNRWPLTGQGVLPPGSATAMPAQNCRAILRMVGPQWNRRHARGRMFGPGGQPRTSAAAGRAEGVATLYVGAPAQRPAGLVRPPQGLAPIGGVAGQQGRSAFAARSGPRVRPECSSALARRTRATTRRPPRRRRA